MPKLTIDLVLAYLGGVYIVESPDDEALLMNTLAVVFIAEIEELLYLAFTSDAMRHSLESMRPVEVSMGNRQRLASWFTCSILFPVFTVLASLAVMDHTRRMNCPDFVMSGELIVDVARSFLKVT